MPRQTSKKPSKKPSMEIVSVASAPMVQTQDKVALTYQAIQTSVARLETVRRFIATKLNAGQRRLERQIGKREPTAAEKLQLKALEIDYGTIPGVKKQFLLQPGAEKICQWLHVRPVYETSVERIDTGQPGHIDVVARCRLVTVAHGDEVFSGPMASCTTMETNYRYRWVKMDPPPTREWIQTESKMAKELGTHKCWPIKEGNTIKEWVWNVRRDNPNIYDERNKVRQMAEKRALVKAVRNFGALSEIFTEDPSEWVLDSDTSESSATEEPITPGEIKRDAPPPVKTEPAAAPQQEVKPSGKIEIRWPSDTSDVAFIFTQDADYGAKIRDFCEWKAERMAWVCPSINVPDAVEIASRMGLTVIETEEGQYTVKETAPKPQMAKSEAEPAIQSGKVSLVKKQPGNKGDYYIVIFAGKTTYCYRTTLYEHLAKSLNKTCEFVVLPGQYPKITAIKRIGETEFDGDVPVIQRSAQ